MHVLPFEQQYWPITNDCCLLPVLATRNAYSPFTWNTQKYWPLLFPFHHEIRFRHEPEAAVVAQYQRHQPDQYYLQLLYLQQNQTTERDTNPSPIVSMAEGFYFGGTGPFRGIDNAYSTLKGAPEIGNDSENESGRSESVYASGFRVPDWIHDLEDSPGRVDHAGRHDPFDCESSFDTQRFRNPREEDGTSRYVRGRRGSAYAARQQLSRDVMAAIATSHDTRSRSDSGNSEVELASVADSGSVKLENALELQEETGKQRSEQPPDDAKTWLDARLLSPQSYLATLDRLKAEVLARSMLEFYSVDNLGKHSTQGDLYHTSIGIPFPAQSSRKLCRDQDVKKFFDVAILNAGQYFTNNLPRENRDMGQDLAHIDRLDHVFHLIESRNTILRVCGNIDAMKAVAYCESTISILVRDRFRINVAKLIPIGIDKIKTLATSFETALRKVLDDRESPPAPISGLLGNITDSCAEIGQILDLDWSSISAMNRWRYTVQILDLAVASYATAHVGELELKESGYDSANGLSLPGFRFDVQQFSFRQRSFQCLEGFLNGNKAWILEQLYGGTQSNEDPKLYVSVQAETFADIWGPMWRSSMDGPDFADGLQYWVGNGVILPWSCQSSEADPQLTIQDHEVLCHWMSCTDSPNIHDSPRAPSKPINCDSTLLIGAGTRLTSSDCGLPVNVIKQQLKDAGLLHIPGTIAKTKYLDAEHYSLQGSWSGVAVGTQRSYKIRERTWKQVLIEAWKNDPERRNPQWLEQFLGVEISACTLNARRRRLISVIGSQTMRKYLDSCSIKWISQECREAFFNSLEPDDHTAFRRLWKEHEKDDGWRENMGKAVSLCLEVLFETGNKERGFDVFWVHGTPAVESIVTLSPSDHTWVGFLKDSPDCCTMAILEDVCLEINKYAVRRCRKMTEACTTTYTVLETKICINENLTTMRKVKPYNCSTSPFKYRWRVCSLDYGKPLQFGENGRLLRIPFSENRDKDLLMSWEPPNMFHMAVSWIGRAKGQHREYLVDEELETSPMDVIIFSSKGRSNTALDGKEEIPTLTSLFGVEVGRDAVNSKNPTVRIQIERNPPPINWIELSSTRQQPFPRVI